MKRDSLSTAAVRDAADDHPVNTGRGVPFRSVRGAFTAELEDGAGNPRKYTCGLAGAYDAFGLIGPEFNGLFVLDEVARAVVARELVTAPSGWYGGSGGPSRAQLKALADLRAAAGVGYDAFADALDALAGGVGDHYRGLD